MYPSQFIELLQKVVEHPKALLDAFSNSLLPSYRINSAKSNKPLSENDIPLGYASSAYRCAQDVDFTAEPNLHRGAFYVQEASSIFLEHVLQQLGIPTDSKVLDMCAAPGGKSLILSDYFKQGLVFSNEMDGLRQQILTENIQKWGNANHIITRLDGTFFNKISDYFDLIVLDAPCSGEGMFRKDAYAIKDWSMDKVYQCERIQNKLIDTAFDSLKPGGYLIYSTCTFNTIENEDHFKVTNFIAPSIQIEWEGVQVSKLTNALQLRFFPHQFKGEGLCLHILQKPFAEHNSKSTVSSFKPIDFQSDLFQSPNDFKVISFDGMLYGVSQSMLNTIPEKLLPFIKQLGTELGQMKGKDFIPSQHLVTSEIVSPNVPRLQLDKSNLIKYLQHVPFSALNSVSPGWAVVQYEQHDFGWVKMISTTRMNNYYPKNWRIKSQYISA